MKILETERLTLRTFTEDDFNDLYEMMKDPLTMYAYAHGFSETEVWDWLHRQMLRQAENGFSLWAVIRKSDQRLIGQCGITYQPYRDQTIMEIGYIFHRDVWGNGYATEAAIACRAYGFQTLHADALYSIIRTNNLASIAVAKRNGMHAIDTITKHYYGLDMPHVIYQISRETWQEKNVIAHV